MARCFSSGHFSFASHPWLFDSRIWRGQKKKTKQQRSERKVTLIRNRRNSYSRKYLLGFTTEQTYKVKLVQFVWSMVHASAGHKISFSIKIQWLTMRRCSTCHRQLMTILQLILNFYNYGFGLFIEKYKSWFLLSLTLQWMKLRRSVDCGVAYAFNFSAKKNYNQFLIHCKTYSVKINLL